ncbi:pantothenate kinase 1 isoform X2 [Momordica charantia]|uniref:pantothenate kinase n=1 Tax=Momordica charantia TaxID=3673 RepID=A0A6J1DAA9_MOMCH|nr:pantothenate kinase 1 isoform X2 [Momordica charantia]
MILTYLPPDDSCRSGNGTRLLHSSISGLTSSSPTRPSRPDGSRRLFNRPEFGSPNISFGLGYWRNKELLKNDEVQSSAKVSERNHSILQGRLHFAKFETSKIDDCIAFINGKQPGSQHPKDLDSDKIVVKATGGGAYKFADLFKEKLDFCLNKEDEMDCLVAGANFLLKAVHQEAFTYIGGQKEFVQINQTDLYPYLLVNIGSGVSMIKVDGNGKFERVSGTSLGGGTFWGLGRLLTKCNSFDELLELSHQGNNRVVDMLVGDIFGGIDYAKVGLSSTAIASSFGKAISASKILEDYKPEDLARSLLRLISNNIGQIAYLTALRFGLKRIFFGGFFIRGHSYTMDTISVAVHYWSKGEAQAMFLRYEGFLGALGAFASYNKQGLDNFIQLMQQDPKHKPEFDSTASEGEADEYASIDCSVYID